MKYQEQHQLQRAFAKVADFMHAFKNKTSRLCIWSYMVKQLWVLEVSISAFRFSLQGVRCCNLLFACMVAIHVLVHGVTICVCVCAFVCMCLYMCVCVLVCVACL
jgi:hypothetical protein